MVEKQKKKEKKTISSFSILFLILIFIGIVSVFLNGQPFAPVTLDGTNEVVSQVTAASLSDVLMAPFHGFGDAIDICIFILVLGGFLSIVTKTGALSSGIQHVVKKLNGREIIIIPILMILFSIGGTTYGMAEETIAFYALITVTLVAAGFDTVVAVGTVMLGAGVGVLGSTVNPFSTGVAMDALKGIGVEPNAAIILAVGTVLWLTTLAFCIWYVMRYAKKVIADKGSTILSLQEQEMMKANFVEGNEQEEVEVFSSKHKLILWIFAFTFIVMVISLIPWSSFNITIFDGWTTFLTGNKFGDWYFGDLATWFLLMSIIVGVLAKMDEKTIIDTFIAGAQDILSVVLIIVVARGVSVLMATTHLDLLILDQAATALQGLSPILFVLGTYVLYLFLSFLIPSTSGLAYVSIPVIGGLAHSVGFSPEVIIMVFAAGSGLINLVTPTSGVVMGGLEISKVEYTTWIKFIKLPLLVIAAMSVVILIASILIF